MNFQALQAALDEINVDSYYRREHFERQEAKRLTKAYQEVIRKFDSEPASDSTEGCSTMTTSGRLNPKP